VKTSLKGFETKDIWIVGLFMLIKM
jgi:hypothetical protein